ncbi:hypothetical protein QR680_012977 [Steinernema hermaphroditum]|uniref:MULE transposase domain-containing protein n=1 Tax=Steinernema hermaphroditum TaxID=289476 RepID=A0AA39I6S8_9BILA|nr:hypothetical protein QR680_012977 [Steinernema hermaphroditum]
MTVLGNSVGSRTVRQMAVVRPKVPYRTREEQADIDLKKELRQPLDFLRPEQRKTIEHLSDCAKRIDLLEAFDRHVAENRARPILERVKNIADDVAQYVWQEEGLHMAPRSSYRRELSAAINWRLECKQKEKKADMARYVKRIEQGYKLALKQRGIPYACRFLVKSPEHDEALHRVRRMFYGTSSSEREARCLGNKKLRKDLAKRRGELMHEKQPEIATYHCQLRCAYCEARLETQLAYIAHVQKHHNSNHTIERKILESEEEFQRWVASLKKRYGVDFVKRRGDKKTAAGRTVRMFCSRSGSNVKGPKLTQSGIIPKMSVRCGKDCTAFLIAHFTESNVSVEYCLEHAGHIIEAEDGKWMRLSSEDRNWILALLRDNRSAEYIVEQIGRRNEVPAYDRLQYISRRDIYDIDRRHNARNFRLDNDDLSSIRKRAGHDEDLHGFVEPTNDTGEGFCLIIGTEYQRELLLRYGREAICFDSTHNVTKYALRLVTVLVFTESGVARAAGHCLCYQESAADMLPFFKWIYERMDGIIPLFLMTDDSSAFVNAYKEAFEAASSETQHILCSWHVKRSWNRRLDVDVKDPEKREVVKQYLNKIPREKNHKKLDELISNMLTFLWNNSLQNYATYFASNYLTDERVKKWAAPYREGAVVNCNMGLERFHLLLKDDYLRFRQNKRIDELADLLIKYSTDSFRKDKHLV